MEPQELYLDLEAAEDFLHAIPLQKLGDGGTLSGPPSPRPSLFRQTSGTSDASWGCNRAGDGGEPVCPMSLDLDVLGAEHFLLSLDVVDAAEYPDRDEGYDDGNASPPEASEPARRKKGARPRAKRYPRSEDHVRPGIIGRGLLGGRAIMARRRHGNNIISTIQYVDNASILQVQSRSEAKSSHAQARKPARCLLLCPQRREQAEVIGTSYKRYLVPTDACSYDPDFLDDRSTQPSEALTGASRPSERSDRSSVFAVKGKSKFKQEMNEQYQQKHPWLHASMTLSKLRNLQKDLREMTLVIPELDISTVAIAWVYFERLVLGNYVRKGNRKLLAAACLVLAFKFNQHGDRASLSQLACCIRKLDRKDSLNLDDLQDAELKVFVWLKFSLRSSDADVYPHLHRMLADLGRDTTQYYGAEALRGTGSSFCHPPRQESPGVDHELSCSSHESGRHAAASDPRRHASIAE